MVTIVGDQFSRYSRLEDLMVEVATIKHDSGIKDTRELHNEVKMKQKMESGSARRD